VKTTSNNWREKKVKKMASEGGEKISGEWRGGDWKMESRPDSNSGRMSLIINHAMFHDETFDIGSKENFSFL